VKTRVFIALATIFTVVAIAVTIWAIALPIGAPAHADPGPQCNGPGLPRCAGAPDPNTLCAVIAWRTMTPCNYWGVQVPQGTPGSWG
jgi:hypothetical protein